MTREDRDIQVVTLSVTIQYQLVLRGLELPTIEAFANHAISHGNFQQVIDLGWHWPPKCMFSRPFSSIDWDSLSIKFALNILGQDSKEDCMWFDTFCKRSSTTNACGGQKSSMEIYGSVELFGGSSRLRKGINPSSKSQGHRNFRIPTESFLRRPSTSQQLKEIVPQNIE